MIGATYLERGRPVLVLSRWRTRTEADAVSLAFEGPARGAPHNVPVQRIGGEKVVRPFRGLRASAGRRGEGR